ncbi:hypothetical protein D3C76_940630 [compost metagenome]|uniref:RHS repeat-associated core domain-containing protein n=1 Tax=Pseudomonas TaxID=286 RepID=UPI0009BCBB56|nr:MULTISPECIES: RHS repeat-associated core domain-containing protein [Pseudomonas]MCI1021156.1 RHS repeat-associated core domain-containing protein [Pseudomonas putida]MDN4512417.1 RHS repeat-associated core domain-containing protein [Pseudomonas sp. 2,4-D]PWY44278.1 RHS repeat-associated core domain-containing protein [Pseudomonas sp. RW405]
MKQQTPTQFFYNKQNLSTLTTEPHTTTLFRTTDLALGELGPEKKVFLAVNDSSSVLEAGKINETQKNSYSAYGYNSAPASALGFNGEYLDHFLENYILGSYRTFSPGLMRFCSPDSYSPFDKGGINAYVYCLGDPINRIDPSGHMGLIKFLTGGYSRKTLISRFSSVVRPLKTLGQAKDLSLSQNEYSAAKKMVNAEVDFFTGKVEKYKAKTAANYDRKTVAQNSYEDELKYAQYTEHLENITIIRDDLYSFTEGTVDGKTRLFTKANQTKYLELLFNEPNTTSSPDTLSKGGTRR